jgi:hypothetical protein
MTFLMDGWMDGVDDRDGAAAARGGLEPDDRILLDGFCQGTCEARKEMIEEGCGERRGGGPPHEVPT